MNPTINPPLARNDKPELSTSSTTLPGLSLRVNFSWTLVGNLVYAAAQWGWLVVLSKLGSPELVGQFALGLALTAPIIMFSNLALRAVQATDARQEYLFGDYLGLRLITSTLAMLVIAGIVAVSGYQWHTALVILAMGLARAFEAVSDIFFGLLQQHERMDRVAISRLIKGPVSLIALAAVVYLTGDIFWGTIALAVSWLLILFGYDIPVSRRLLQGISQPPDKGLVENPARASLRPYWDPGTLARLAWLALPLGIATTLVALNVNIPRYFIEAHGGVYELGIFAAVASLMKAGSMVVDALGRSTSPRLAKYYAANKKAAFRKLVLRLVGIAIFLGGSAVLIASIAGDKILTLLYQAEYARQDLLVVLMIVGGLTFITSFLGYAVTAARYFRIQLLILSFVLASTALASFWLVPSLGLMGAALALTIGALVQLVAYLVVTVYALRSIPNADVETVQLA